MPDTIPESGLRLAVRRHFVALMATMLILVTGAGVTAAATAYGYYQYKSCVADYTTAVGQHAAVVGPVSSDVQEKLFVWLSDIAKLFTATGPPDPKFQDQLKTELDDYIASYTTYAAVVEKNPSPEVPDCMR